MLAPSLMQNERERERASIETRLSFLILLQRRRRRPPLGVMPESQVLYTYFTEKSIGRGLGRFGGREWKGGGAGPQHRKRLSRARGDKDLFGFPDKMLRFFGSPGAAMVLGAGIGIIIAGSRWRA